MQQDLPTASQTPDTPVIKRLFRNEAVEHLAHRQYGTILLVRPLSHTVLSCFFAGIAIAILAFFILFSTTSKAQSQGVLLPSTGLIRIVPTQTGIITKVFVREGQTVKAGDKLFVLSAERTIRTNSTAEQTVSSLLRSRRDSLQAEIQQLASQVDHRKAVVARRIVDYQADIARLLEQISLQENRVNLSEQSYRRYRELQETNFISAAQLQEKQSELLDQRQRLFDLQRVLTSGKQNLSNSRAELEEIELQSHRDNGAITRNVSSLDQELVENEARREIVISSPQDGLVSTLIGSPGQVVSPGSMLMLILPADTELEAEIYVPSRSIGFIKQGMPVQLRYQAFPYQKFGQHTARVREVAKAALRQEELGSYSGVTGSSAELFYRVRLKLDKQFVKAFGSAVPLQSGMQLEASIQLEHRKLYEWVLDPLFSISGRF